MNHLKDYLKTAYALLLHPVYLLRDKTRVFHSRITGHKKNSISLNDAWVSDSSIAIVGTDNTFHAEGCHLFNSSVLVKGSGHTITIEPGVQLYNIRIKVIGKDNKLYIGKDSSFGGGNIIHGGRSLVLSIGEKCFIAEGVDIWSTDTHTIFENNCEKRCLNHPQSIHIGNHVWIGKDVAILKGVNIGDNAIIGMKSLVTKDIQSESLNVGSPSRCIKEGVSWISWNPN